MKSYTIIIFGGTGDLASRKLLPAINSLATKNSDFKINVLGIGRRDYNDATYPSFLSQGKEIAKNVKIYYYLADIEKDNSLDGLRKKLEQIEPTEVEGRIYYLATKYEHFESIVKNIKKNHQEKGFARIIAEKPFGHDLSSSRKLNKTLKKHLKEEQIYLADHYLAKETVNNIIRVRFSNPLFESVWNSKSISSIKIVVDEELGVGSRLGYYEGTGAIKDMIQNHLLQTLSLILMNSPKSLDSNELKKEKIKAVKKLEFNGKLITGQYKGYKEEAKATNPNSNTETFAEVILSSKDKRWKGTKITLRTGKMLKKREAYIELEFKKEPCVLYCNVGSAPNKLILHIQPLQNIELTVNTKLPGEKAEIEPVTMSFCPTCQFNAETPEGYEIIIRDCLQGDKRIFISEKELDAAWKLTDKIVVSAKNKTPIIYEKGSLGPKSN